MKKSRFTETQIVSILNEADAGIKVQDLCRQHGICPATFHRWKSKYGGMAASDLKRMKELAWGMAWIQDQLLKFGRIFVFAEMQKIARQNGLSHANFYPCDPFSSERLSRSISFHLKRADKAQELKESSMNKDAIKLASGKSDDVMSCYIKKWRQAEYSTAYNYYKYKSSNVTFIYSSLNRDDLISDHPRGNSFTESSGNNMGSAKYIFKEARTTKCKKIPSILKGGLKLPNPLVMKKDFQKRMRLLVLASNKPLKDVPSQHAFSLSKSFYALSQAKPYGHSVFDMEWTARLEPVSLHKKLFDTALCLRDGLFRNGIGLIPDMVKH